MILCDFEGMYSLECDVCGEEAEQVFEDFYEAVEWKKDRSNGWTSRKNKDGSWIEVCPECNGNSEREE